MVLIKTHRDTLLAPLQSVSGIVERRHTLPILSNVLLEKHGDRLTLLATASCRKFYVPCLKQQKSVWSSKTSVCKYVQEKANSVCRPCRLMISLA